MPITRGMDPKDYHQDPAAEPSLSSTLARALLNQSPRHAWWASPRLNPEWLPTVKTEFDVGHAAHTAILSRGAGIAVIDADDWRTNAAKAEREEARAAGLTPLLLHQALAVEAYRDAVLERLTLMGLGEVFSSPDSAEVVAIAEIDGCWCRAMIDYQAADGWVYDLKTTTDAKPEAVRRSVESYGYHIQAAHYLDTWRAAGGEARGIRFVFVEKSPPHEVSVVELTDDMSAEDDWGEVAREQCADARAMWRRCLEADHWPGYPPAILTIGAPDWVRGKWADRREIVAAQAPRKPSKTAKAVAAAMQEPA